MKLRERRPRTDGVGFPDVSPPPKHLVALKLLESSGVFVHLDPRHRDVVVPAQFKTQQELVLQFGLNMRVPIKDLEVEEDSISGTLSFSRRPFWCKIPWFAVYAIVSDTDRRGFSWGPAPGPVGAAAPAPKRSHLRAVGADEQSPSSSESAGAGTCKHCSIKWPEDSDSCALCGGLRADAFLADAFQGVAMPGPPSSPPGEETGSSTTGEGAPSNQASSYAHPSEAPPS